MSKFMYVGPTIPGIAVRNAVYEERPAGLEKAVKNNPYLGGLCVRIPEASKALSQLAKGQGGIHTLYTRALAESSAIQKGAI